MYDYCCFCDTRRPDGGTHTLVLNSTQPTWLEFCTSCGDREWLQNKLTGERCTVYNLFAKGKDLPYRPPTQSFEEWEGGQEATQAAPVSKTPTLADVWPR